MISYDNALAETINGLYKAGYVPLSQIGAELLFEVFSQCLYPCRDAQGLDVGGGLAPSIEEVSGVSGHAMPVTDRHKPRGGLSDRLQKIQSHVLHVRIGR